MHLAHAVLQVTVCHTARTQLMPFACCASCDNVVQLRRSVVEGVVDLCFRRGPPQQAAICRTHSLASNSAGGVLKLCIVVCWQHYT